MDSEVFLLAATFALRNCRRIHTCVWEIGLGTTLRHFPNPVLVWSPVTARLFNRSDSILHKRRLLYEGGCRFVFFTSTNYLIEQYNRKPLLLSSIHLYSKRS